MVTIVPHKSSWVGEFQSIGLVLREALGVLALRIDHIGSTAVPGLAAKDCIDIQVTVESLIPPVEQALNRIGYTRLEHLTDHPPPGGEAQPSQWVKWVFKPSNNQRHQLARPHCRARQPAIRAALSRLPAQPSFHRSRVRRTETPPGTEFS